MDVFARQFNFGWTEAAVVTTLSAWLGYSILSAYRDRNGPPSVPYYIPIIGHTYQLQVRPKEFLQECREKYGNVFSLNYLGKRVIVFSNEEATEMMKIQDLTISDGRNELFLIMDVLGDWHGAPGKPEKIINSREVIQEKLGPMLKRVLPDVLVRIHQAIDDQLVKGEGGRRALDIKTFFSDIVVYTVSILLVGHDLAKDEVLTGVMAGYFSDVENMMVLGLPWHMVPIFGSKIAQTIVRKTTPSIKVRKTIEQRIKATVEARRKLDPQDRPTPNNFLDTLIDDGYPLDSIANSLMVLIFASISTTTGTCQRLLSDLLAHPQFFDKLKQEQAEVLASAPIDPATGMPALNRENLDKMVHLNSAIRETLRHRAYVLEQWRKIPTQRTLNNGMVLPAGSLLAVDMPSVHFNPQVYGALDDDETDPYLYRPSRFVASKTSATRVNFSFMGFGAGKHACPGRFFAVQEVTAVMSVLLRTCNVTTVSGKPGPFHTTGLRHPDMDAVFTRI